MNKDVSDNVRIAIFDLDATLFEGDTTLEFVRFYLKRRHTIRFVEFLVLRELDLIFNYRKISIGFLEGARMDDLQKIAHDFFIASRQKLSKDLLRRIEELKKNGYKLFLISASFDFIVQAFANELGFDGGYGSVVAHENSKCLGYFEKDISGRKQELLSSELAFKDADFASSYCFSDNKEDESLLRLFGNAYAVARNSRDVVFWRNKGIDVITTPPVADFNVLFSLIPFAYTFYSRPNPPFIRNFLLDNFIVAQLITFYFLNIGFSIHTILSFLFALVGFCSIYEIGYAANDCNAFKEKTPSLRASAKICTDLPLFILFKSFTFIIFIAGIYLMGGNYVLFSIYSLATLCIFSFYNTLKENSKLKPFVILLLKMSRIIVPISIFNVNVFIAVLFMILYAAVPWATVHYDVKVKNQLRSRIDYLKIDFYCHFGIFSTCALLFIFFKSPLAFFMMIQGIYFLLIDIVSGLRKFRLLMTRA